VAERFEISHAVSDKKWLLEINLALFEEAGNLE